MDQELDLNEPLNNPSRPRLDDDPAALEDLAASIKLVGLRQLITVFKTPDGWMIEDGHRRRKACLMAGVMRSLCRVVEPPTDPMAGKLRQYHASEFAEKHTNAERLAMVADYRETHPGCTGVQIAKAMTLDPSSVTHLTTVLDADPAVRAAVADKTITLTDGYKIGQLPPDQQPAALDSLIAAPKPKRGPRPKAGAATARVNTLKLVLGGAAVTVTAKRVGMAEVIALLKTLHAEARAALDQNLDCKTWERVLLDRSRKAVANG